MLASSPTSPGWAAGDFTSFPDTTTPRPRAGPSPSRGAQRIPAGSHLPNPVPARSNPLNERPLGVLSGDRGTHGTRAAGKRWPERTESPQAAPYLGAPRAGEAAGSRRGPRSGPLAAGPSWAGAAAAAAGSPGLWAAAAAGAASAPQAPLRSGTRRPQARPLRGPGPGSGPDQHLEPDRNRPTCSSSSSSGLRRCAPDRPRGRRGGPALAERLTQASWRTRPAGRSALSALGPREPAAPQPPPPPLLRSPTLPQTSAPRPRHGRARAGHSGPPRPGGPRPPPRLRPPAGPPANGRPLLRPAVPRAGSRPRAGPVRCGPDISAAPRPRLGDGGRLPEAGRPTRWLSRETCDTDG